MHTRVIAHGDGLRLEKTTIGAGNIRLSTLGIWFSLIKHITLALM